jgi:hypothetical protein
MHSIAYDSMHDEFLVPQQFGQSILTFRGAANGEEPPIRVIQGSQTRLRAPDRLGLDPVHDEIFVPEGWAVLVYKRTAQGNVAPVRILEGPKDSPFRASDVAIDPVHNLMVVGGSAGRGQPRLFIFNRTDEGNAAPKAVIGGPKSHLLSLGGPIAVYPPKEEIVVSVRGSGEVGDLASDESFVGVWSTRDNGDVPPKWMIGGPKGVILMPRGITLDPKNKAMMVSDKRLNAVLTFSFPEMF